MTTFREEFPIVDNMPTEVCDFCLTKIGINIQELESKNHQERDKAYNEKYGELQGNGIKIDFDSMKLFGKYE